MGEDFKKKGGGGGGGDGICESIMAELKRKFNVVVSEVSAK